VDGPQVNSWWAAGEIWVDRLSTILNTQLLLHTVTNILVFLYTVIEKYFRFKF